MANLKHKVIKRFELERRGVGLYKPIHPFSIELIEHTGTFKGKRKYYILDADRVTIQTLDAPKGKETKDD